LLNKSISKKNEEINNFGNEILKLFFGFQNRINKERMRIIDRVLNGGTALFNSNHVRLAANEREQDSPCATLIRFCLFVPRPKLAENKFRIVCQK